VEHTCLHTHTYLLSSVKGRGATETFYEPDGVHYVQNVSL